MNNASGPKMPFDYTRVSQLGELWLGQIELNDKTGLYERWERPVFEIRWELVEIGSNPTSLIPSEATLGGGTWERS